jgi:hypothetical protein
MAAKVRSQIGVWENGIAVTRSLEKRSDRRATIPVDVNTGRVLDLKEAHPALWDQARKAYEDGDAGRFLISAYSNQCALAMVFDNIWLLKQRGIYEQCLLEAFTGCRVNHHEWPEGVLDFMFREADHERLRRAGEPLPGQGPFEVYRGVAGRGRARRLRGYCWTASIDAACWFAARLNLAHPAVLFAAVSAAEVLAYTNDRDEEEFICKPKEQKRLVLCMSEIEDRARTHTRHLEERQKEKLKALKMKHRRS